MTIGKRRKKLRVSQILKITSFVLKPSSLAQNFLGFCRCTFQVWLGLVINIYFFGHRFVQYELTPARLICGPWRVLFTVLTRWGSPHYRWAPWLHQAPLLTEGSHIWWETSHQNDWRVHIYLKFLTSLELVIRKLLYFNTVLKDGRTELMSHSHAKIHISYIVSHVHWRVAVWLLMYGSNDRTNDWLIAETNTMKQHLIGQKYTII